MILIDAGPLIALADERDSLHRRAVADLKRLGRKPRSTCVPVLTEVCFGLAEPYLRQRLRALLVRLEVGPCRVDPAWDDVLGWLERYAEHEPDWTDGWLAVASSMAPNLRVWTYDREFSSTWRRMDGSRIPLVVEPRR